MIKAVLLDVDNTLLDFNKCACAAMYDAARDFSLALPERTPFPLFAASTMDSGGKSRNRR